MISVAVGGVAVAVDGARLVWPTTGIMPVDTPAMVAKAKAKVEAAKRAAEKPLRVATYNVRCATCDTNLPNEKPWAKRRGAVVATIKNQHLDVLAVQEASQGKLHDSASRGHNVSQFEDLRNRLGSPWKLTDVTRYNCRRDESPNHCHYVYKGASEGQRILYNSNKVKLISAGSKLLPVPKGKGDNYMNWAQFQQKSTKKKFMFSNLHTVGIPSNQEVKTTQAEVALAEIQKRNPKKLPMIAVGDWNSDRFDKPANGPYDTYLAAGFKDPLGQAYGSLDDAPGDFVERRIHTELDSSNGNWLRQAPSRPGALNGRYIDYILVTPMAVREWETVADLDSAGRYIGIIPSDHNMIRATIVLP